MPHFTFTTGKSQPKSSFTGGRGIEDFEFSLRLKF